MRMQFDEWKRVTATIIPNVYESTKEVRKGVPYAIIGVNSNSYPVVSLDVSHIESTECFAEIVYPNRSQVISDMLGKIDMLIDAYMEMQDNGICVIRPTELSVLRIQSQESEVRFMVTASVTQL